jgi:glyoxylase-like metal-dependent hydrolase (beta-lactamase superfamily II)
VTISSAHSRERGNPEAKNWIPAGACARASRRLDPSAGTSGVTETPFEIDIAELRRLAGLIPGARPVAVNGIRVAASIRPRKFVIAGGDDTPVTMPRTAFQVVYPDSTVMLDSGLDKETHDSFSEPGKREPYFPEGFARLQRALDAARMIVLTHFHADHVAGVTQAANFDMLAAKAIVSAHTLDLMTNAPHRPHLKLTPARAARFTVIGYDKYYPVAPGLVLFKAAGHSPDHQMAFIALADGREILHSVDAAWNFDNIRQIKGKAAPWVKEDAPAVMGQLRWLNALSRDEPNVTILVTHDDERFAALTAQGVLGELAV